MRNFLSIWRREMKACFCSPVAYVTMIAFLLLVGATFMSALARQAGTAETPSALLFATVVLWMTFLVAVVSMRLFSEENRSGTLETLMTAPVTEAEAVLGKYAAGLSFVLIAILPCVSYPFILVAMNPAMETADLGAMAGGVAIVLLLAAFCQSVGLLVSIMTKNQIIAAMCCFAAVWLALLFAWLVSALPLGLAGVAEQYSAMNHLADFTRGLIDTRAVVLYTSATVFMLFAAVRVLEWRRWA